MGWLNILGIAIGLAMDAFAVSIATGLTLDRVTPRHTFRIAFHFGLFQFLMPIIGWFAGRELSQYIVNYDHWIAFVILSFIGGKMFWEASSDDEDKMLKDPTRGWTLITLSVATSLDALAVGVSMALLNVSVWTPSLVIGLVTASLCTLGILFGSKLGSRWSHWAEILGGAALVCIGLKILLDHLLYASPALAG